MVLVVFGGFCARTDAVVQKSYLVWVPTVLTTKVRETDQDDWQVSYVGLAF